MAAGNTYVALATNTLTGTAASVTFSSISGAYTDLVVVVNGAKDAGGAVNPYLRFNSDSGTNYSHTSLVGDGTTASSGRASTQAQMYLGDYTTTQSTYQIHIMNYANATTYKTVLTRSAITNSATGVFVGLWRSTAAITSVDIYVGGSNFAIGSTFTLYGIAAA